MKNTPLDVANAIISKLRAHRGFEGWWIGQHPDFQKNTLNEISVLVARDESADEGDKLVKTKDGDEPADKAG